MRKYLFMAFVLCTIDGIQAQKSMIDSSVYGKWPSIGEAQISPDGAYVGCLIRNLQGAKNTLVLSSTQSNWRKEIDASNFYNLAFTPNSRFAIYRTDGDSIVIVKLGEAKIYYVCNAQSYGITNKLSGSRIAFRKKDTLILSNLETGQYQIIDSVIDFLFSDNGKNLILIRKEFNDLNKLVNVSLTDCINGSSKIIWRGIRAGNVIANPDCSKVAFTGASDLNDPTLKQIFCYDQGVDSAICLYNEVNSDSSHQMKLAGIDRFSQDGTMIFCRLKEIKKKLIVQPGISSLDIWSWSDYKLQSQQLHELDYDLSYTAVLNIRANSLVRMQFKYENLRSSNFSANGTDEYLLVDKTRGEPVAGEKTARFQEFLVSCKTNERIFLSSYAGFLSPDNHFVVFFDRKKGNYFSYNTRSRIFRNITKGIYTNWYDFRNRDFPEASRPVRGIAGWGDDGKYLFVYDQYDIWQIDLSGAKQPLNLTNGYGRRNNVILSLALNYSGKTISSTGDILLMAFNRSDKSNGFFLKHLIQKGDPELLSTGPYIYYIPNHMLGDNGGTPPLKAADADVYLVRRMSATESPNWFVTSDFVTFKAITSIYPEAKFNWMKTELISWKSGDNSILQGVLFKPENFDAKRKYPLIFYYYQNMSDGLNGYLEPGPSVGDLNIPWYVSNGYLVFTPDIHFKTGLLGPSVTNSIVSAALYLSHFPWVNSKRMGIQGISLGGYETNFLVTHTQIFAAACSASGLSDLVSGYGSLGGGGNSLQGMYESTFWRMGVDLWKDPQRYIKNSPIFHVDQVTTPLLLMHTKRDGVCPFPNAIEFFTGLRRLQKKAWLLQYDNGDHCVYDQDALDFSIRMSQFFDHYLKDAPPPRWMTEGVPARLKGIDFGLDLDLSGKQP